MFPLYHVVWVVEILWVNSQTLLLRSLFRTLTTSCTCEILITFVCEHTDININYHIVATRPRHWKHSWCISNSLLLAMLRLKMKWTRMCASSEHALLPAGKADAKVRIGKLDMRSHCCTVRLENCDPLWCIPPPPPSMKSMHLQVGTGSKATMWPPSPPSHTSQKYAPQTLHVKHTVCCCQTSEEKRAELAAENNTDLIDRFSFVCNNDFIYLCNHAI